MAAVRRAGVLTAGFLMIAAGTLAAQEPRTDSIAPIIVNATRLEGRIENQPERVELLAQEDVGEKTLAKPGSMKGLLVEMPGVHLQHVGGGLGGAQVRIQALPGEYTLLLTDGLPLYGTRAPAFTLAQTPPIDLQQVEVIKGVATALYGAPAFAGVVDLISQKPGHARDVLLGQSTRAAADGVLWLADKLSPAWGYTLVAGAHRQTRADQNGDGWTDAPGLRRVEARPRVFWNSQQGSSVMVTASGMSEERKAGGSFFRDDLTSRHADAGAIGRIIVSENGFVTARASVMTNEHTRTFAARDENTTRNGQFAEITYARTAARNAALVGAALAGESFRMTERADLKYDFSTAALFAQDTWSPSEIFSITTTTRLEHHNTYGSFFAPRVSALYRFAPGWTARAAAASGYFAPTPIVRETEEVGFSFLDVPQPLRASTGQSVSLDVGTTHGPVQLNATLFGARIHHPTQVEDTPGTQRFSLTNAIAPLSTTGAEILAAYTREPVIITGIYSHINAPKLSLVPRNSGGVDVAFEENEKGEAGVFFAVEVFYTGRQRVEDDPFRKTTPGYTLVEGIVSKQLGRVTAFASAENLTNIRQTDWDPVMRPAPGIGGRLTTDEWAPLEGRSVTFGVRARL